MYVKSWFKKYWLQNLTQNKTCFFCQMHGWIPNINPGFQILGIVWGVFFKTFCHSISALGEDCFTFFLTILLANASIGNPLYHAFFHCVSRRFYSHSPTQVGDSFLKKSPRKTPCRIFFRFCPPEKSSYGANGCRNRWVGGPESNRKSIARPCRQPRRCAKI